MFLFRFQSGWWWWHRCPLPSISPHCGIAMQIFVNGDFFWRMLTQHCMLSQHTSEKIVDALQSDRLINQDSACSISPEGWIKRTRHMTFQALWRGICHGVVGPSGMCPRFRQEFGRAGNGTFGLDCLKKTFYFFFIVGKKMWCNKIQHLMLCKIVTKCTLHWLSPSVAKCQMPKLGIRPSKVNFENYGFPNLFTSIKVPIGQRIQP